MTRIIASTALAVLMVLYGVTDLYIRFTTGHYDPYFSTSATIFLAAWFVHAARA